MKEQSAALESESDRRMRAVPLTEKGRKLFVLVFRRLAGLVKKAFQDVSPEEQKQSEDVLKRIGKRAEALTFEEIEEAITRTASIRHEPLPPGAPFIPAG